MFPFNNIKAINHYKALHKQKFSTPNLVSLKVFFITLWTDNKRRKLMLKKAFL